MTLPIFQPTKNMFKYLQRRLFRGSNICQDIWRNMTRLWTTARWPGRRGRSWGSWPTRATSTSTSAPAGGPAPTPPGSRSTTWSPTCLGSPGRWPCPPAPPARIVIRLIKEEIKTRNYEIIVVAAWLRTAPGPVVTAEAAAEIVL